MSDLIRAEMLDRFIDIERPKPPKAFGKAGTGTWEKVAEDVRAQVQDSLPGTAERMVAGANIATRRARVRMRWRDDVTSDMRIIHNGRAMKIVSGPAEIGRREGLEFIVEAVSPGASGS